jgi:ligand-binding sensor domain-containing protein/PAS domain-containing protein
MKHATSATASSFFAALILLAQPELAQAQLADPASSQHVLQLGGTNGFVELPTDAFTNLDQATIEGWVRWDSLNYISRFVDFTFAGFSLNIQNRFNASMLRVESFQGDDLRALDIPDFLPLGGWVHVAVTAGLKEFGLFVNGRFMGTNEPPYQFSTTGLETRNYLGRSNFKAVYPTDADFCGQMAEVRVWKGFRTPEQIRANMFKRLTGREEDLVGLWNFADGTANDASPAGHHGKMSGQVRVGEGVLPSADTLVPWSRLLVRVTDPTGLPTRGVTIRAQVNGEEVGRATGEVEGEVQLSVWTTAPGVDLVASGSNSLGGWRSAVPITAYAQRSDTWRLARSLDVAGHVTGLDGKTPHPMLLIELVQPRVGVQNPSGLKQKEQIAQARSAFAKTNHVLRLDGNSFLELPSGIFKSLTQATVEGWVKWDRLAPSVSFASFGTYGTTIGIAAGGGLVGGDQSDLVAWLMPHPMERHVLAVPNTLRTNEWYHLALVTGSGGMKLFLNGVVVGTLPYTDSFAALEKNNENRFGANVTTGPPLAGQLGEVRIWSVQRTAEEIRENMFQQLSGSEVDLFGLWNFDDPTDPGRDSSPGAHHASPHGNPTVGPGLQPALVYGSINDAAGKPVPNASISIHQRGQPDRQILGGSAGDYAFTVASGLPCDLYVTSGDLSAYRLGFEPSPDLRERLDWTLEDPDKTSVTLERSGRLATESHSSRVVATVLSDDKGNFRFPNVKPGVYQVRAQIPGGRAWFEAGRVLYADVDLTDADRSRLESLEFAVTPFNHGRWRSYSVLDGLKNNSTGLNLFTQDGALWNCAACGLSRFDGREFFTLTSENGLSALSSAPLAACQDDSGMFWIGTSAGIWRYRQDGGAAPEGFSALDLPTAEITEMERTADGAVWWRTRDKLVRYQNGRGDVFGGLWRPDPGDPLSAALYPTIFPKRLAAAGKYLWLTGPGAGLVRLEGTNQLRWGATQGLPAGEITTITISPEGQLWLATDQATLARFDGTNFYQLNRWDGVPQQRITSLLATQDGRLWLGMGDGNLARFDGRSFTYFEPSSAVGLQTRSATRGYWNIQAGPDGSIWFGTDDRLWRFEEHALQHYSQPEGLLSNSVTFLKISAGQLTVGTGLNAIARFDGKRFQPMLLPVSATAVQSGPDGTLYLSLSEPNAYQLAVMRDDNIVGVFTNAPGMSWTEVSCFDRSKDGSLWAGTTSKGIFRFPAATGTVQRYNLGLLTNQVNVIRCDLTGGTWVGVNGGIVRLDGTVRQEFRESEGAPGKHLFAIEAGAEGNVWFAAEDGGLSRFDGKSMQPIPPGSGAFVPGSVQRILRDASGSLWFATMTGVTRYDGTSWVPLDEGDGLLPGYINSLAQDVSGAMWFGCDAGVTRYQPAVFKNPSPSLTVQADRLYTDLKSLPRITAGRLVTFKFSSVDFRTRPEKRLYRWAVIPGQTNSVPEKNDRRWSPTSREDEFSWPAAKRGDFTVFIQSIDRDLNYSVPAVAHLTVVPPWYANALIVAPGGAVFVGLLGWAFLARSIVIRRKRETETLREQLLREEKEARQRLEQQVAETRKAEASVRESQELYHSLVENIPHAVIRKDVNGVWTFSNSMSADLLQFDFKRGELIGKTDYDLFAKELADGIRAADQKVMETGESLEGDQ